MSTPQHTQDAGRRLRDKDPRVAEARGCYREVIAAFALAERGPLLLKFPLPVSRIEQTLEMLALGGPESPYAASLRVLLKRKPARGTRVPQAFLAWIRRNPDLVRAVLDTHA